LPHRIRENNGKFNIGTWVPAGKAGVRVHLKRSTGQEETKRYLQEAAKLARLSHPNIITSHGYLMEDSHVCPLYIAIVSSKMVQYQMQGYVHRKLITVAVSLQHCLFLVSV
jgi:serine/threonine protein kinase